MTINKIHHINYVVKDLAASSQYLQKLLQQEPVFETLNNRGAETARFQLGDTWLVLVAPNDEQSVVGQILKTRGEGLFLLSLSVDDLEQQIEKLEKQGITMNETGARKGLANWTVHDLQAPPAFAPIIQLCEEKG